MTFERTEQKGLMGWLHRIFGSEPKVDTQASKQDNFNLMEWYAKNPAGYEVSRRTGRELGNMLSLDYNFKKNTVYHL